jgi:hypothetical protein
VFSITVPQIAALEAGLYYFNIHDAEFPGGEIRGQITRVPDDGPGFAAILGVVAVCLLAGSRRRLAVA